MEELLIETVKADSAIDWSPHHHAFVNPYNGCTAGCPFCFWLSRPGWEGRIQIRENITELLENELKKYDPNEFIYFGSICDPFMEIDRELGLSRKCLELIREYQIPLLITTSATNDVVRRDVDVLKSMNQRVIVVVELSRLKLLREWNSGGIHTGIENANYLFEQGLEVWTTLSPILPGVTDLERVLKELNPAIPVYVDSLQCEKGGIQERKVLNWIRAEYPELEEQYRDILLNSNTGYFDELLETYKSNQRVMTFPYRLD